MYSHSCTTSSTFSSVWKLFSPTASLGGLKMCLTKEATSGGYRGWTHTHIHTNKMNNLDCPSCHMCNVWSSAARLQLDISTEHSVMILPYG